MGFMLFRKIALFSAALAALCCASALHAQLGLYATITGERTNGITCVDPQKICASNDGAVRPYGTAFGAYYDFRTYGPVRLGVDFRGGVTNTNKPADYYGASTDKDRHYSALGGLRLSFATPIKHIRPYVGVDGGFARLNFDSLGGNPSLDYRNYTQVQGAAGVDVPLFSGIELRAIEFTGGEIFGPVNHTTGSIGAGIAYRFGR
jgi:hypothetical protein